MTPEWIPSITQGRNNMNSFDDHQTGFWNVVYYGVLVFVSTILTYGIYQYVQGPF
jgi:hypothetical protein